MKKNLLCTILFVFVSICSGWGQWEKVTGQFIGTTNYPNYIFHKNTIGIFTMVGDRLVIFYSNNKTTNWKKIVTPVKSDEPINGNVLLNSEGFFVLEKGLEQSNTIIHKTSDFGKTWTSDTLPASKSKSTGMYLKNQELCIRAFYQVSFPGLSILDTNYCFVLKNGKWIKDNNPLVALSDSKNRQWWKDDLKNQLIISDFNGKLLANIDLSNRPNVDVGTIFAQDSMIIMVPFLSQGYDVFISNDLGKNWTMSRYPETPPLGIRINGSTAYAFSRNLHKTDDLGKTWVSISDDVNKEYFQPSKQVIRGLHFVDSVMYMTTGSAWGSYFTKNINETKWAFCNNINTEFGVIKADDSTLLAVHDYRFVQKSNDRGKTWQRPYRYEVTPLSSNQYQSDVQVIIAIDNSLWTNNGHKSVDYGKTWSKENSFPSFASHIKKNDTVIIKPLNRYTPYSIYFSTKSPHSKWDTINFSPIDIEDNYELLNFDKGIVSIAVNSEIERKRIKIRRFKLDKTELEPIIIDKPMKVAAINDKIWAVSADTNENKIRYSNDFGKTWSSYDLPEKTNSNFFTLKPIGEFLLLARWKRTSFLTSITSILISGDNGKSWSNFDKGLDIANSFYIPSSITVIDSFIYNSANHGLWRANLKDLQLKLISGNIYFDANKNGKRDLGEKPVISAQVLTSKSGGFTMTDSLGNYSMFVDLKSTDTLKTLVDSKYATYTPQYILVSQSDTAKNIGISVPDIQDLVINATAVTPPRSGFNNNYLLTFKNTGATVKSGKIIFTLNAKQSLVQAKPAVTTNANNVLVWNYTNLQPNETRTIDLTLKTAVDMPIRTQVTNVASIDPIATDTFKTDNVDSVFQTVVGSYDPNDIL